MHKQLLLIANGQFRLPVHSSIGSRLNWTFDYIQTIIFQFVKALIDVTTSIVDNLLNGILSFSFLNNATTNHAYTAVFALSLLIIVPKVILELLAAMKDGLDPGMDIGRKFLNICFAVIISASIPVLMTIGMNAQTQVVAALLNGSDTSNMVRTEKEKTDVGNSKKTVKMDSFQGAKDEDGSDLSKGFITSIMYSLGGMDDSDKYHTPEAFYERIVNGKKVYFEGNREIPYEESFTSSEDGDNTNTEKEVNFNPYRRYSTDSEDAKNQNAAGFVEQADKWADGESADSVYIEDKDGNGQVLTGNPHIWRFNLFGMIVGCAICAALLVMLLFQFALRMFYLAFFKIIGPLCCTSLTGDNHQAFNVWRASVLQNYAMNVAQIFMLKFFLTIVDSLPQASSGLSLSAFVLFVAGISACISLPPFINSLFGGYGAGIMNGLSSAANVGRLALAGVGIGAGISKGGIGTAKNMLLGKSERGHEEDEFGKRTGYDYAKQSGGLRGLFAGNVNRRIDKNGNVVSAVRSGGLTSAKRGSLKTNYDPGSGKAANKTFIPNTSMTGRVMSRVNSVKTHAYNAKAGVTNRFGKWAEPDLGENIQTLNDIQPKRHTSISDTNRSKYSGIRNEPPLE